VNEPKRGRATATLLEIADVWAEQTSVIALLLAAKGELGNVDLGGTVMRSQFMLGSQVGIAIAAIDMAAATDIRNEMAEEMAAMPHEDLPHDDVSKAINKIALTVIEAHRGKS